MLSQRCFVYCQNIQLARNRDFTIPGPRKNFEFRAIPPSSSRQACALFITIELIPVGTSIYPIYLRIFCPCRRSGVPDSYADKNILYLCKSCVVESNFDVQKRPQTASFLPNASCNTSANTGQFRLIVLSGEHIGLNVKHYDLEY